MTESPAPLKERFVTITLNPVQAQTLITALQQRIDALRSSAELSIQPGHRGRLLQQMEELQAVHQLTIQAYNAWIGEEGNGKS